MLRNAPLACCGSAAGLQRCRRHTACLACFLRCLPAPPPVPPQYDVHMPLLTVHETLLFARRCMWASGCKNMMEAEAEKVGLVADQRSCMRTGAGLQAE